MRVAAYDFHVLFPASPLDGRYVVQSAQCTCAGCCALCRVDVVSESVVVGRKNCEFNRRLRRNYVYVQHAERISPGSFGNAVGCLLAGNSSTRRR